MINDALRLMRIFHDVAQKDLAKRLQVSPSHLSEIEAGKKRPTLDLLDRYAAEFRIPVSSILFFSEEMQAGKRSERVRIGVSEKVLALLNFIAARAGKEAA